MNKRPCIRGLKEFQKSGCPEKHWDGKEGCPAWKEYTIPGGEGKPPVIMKDCIDMLSEYALAEDIWYSSGVATLL